MYQCESEVANCPIFRDMNYSEREAVLKHSEVVTYTKGVNVIREGNSRPHGVWVVRSGHCEVVHESSLVGEKQVNFLHSGAIFGEISFFDPQPHSATVRAVESTEMLFISYDVLTKLKNESPAAAYKFIYNMGRIVAQKLRLIDRRLVAEMTVTAKTQH